MQKQDIRDEIKRLNSTISMLEEDISYERLSSLSFDNIKSKIENTSVAIENYKVFIRYWEDLL